MLASLSKCSFLIFLHSQFEPPKVALPLESFRECCFEYWYDSLDMDYTSPRATNLVLHDVHNTFKLFAKVMVNINGVEPSDVSP